MKSKSRKGRETDGLILLEGRRLICDAISAGVSLKSVYFCKPEHIEGVPLEGTGAPLYKVQYRHMKIWSDVTTPPGIMAICKIPKLNELPIDTEDLLPITVICDNIRDPGNMGTILRSAVAAGCQKILVTKGCVDIWEPKVLRSGAGCHFRGVILQNLGWEHVGNYLSSNTKVYLAESEADVRIPRPNKHVMKKVSAIEGEVFTELDEDTREYKQVDTTFLDKETVQLHKQVPLPVSTYWDVDYTTADTAVVVGGETEGLSGGAHKLAFDRGGEKVHIPMLPGVDSLNSAMAASIMLFEVKRQRHAWLNHLKSWI